MPWLCDFCGWENLVDDRVARQEPACIRCGHRRGEREATIRALQDNIARLQEEIRGSTALVARTAALIEDCWAEISRLADTHDRAVKDREQAHRDLEEKKTRLQELESLDPAVRRVAPDQVSLFPGVV